MTDTASYHSSTTREQDARRAFRQANSDDWAGIEQLLRNASLPLVGAREHLDDFRLVEEDGRLIGCAAVERYGADGLLRSVAIDQSKRGQGIGLDLINNVIAEMQRIGLARLTLLTETAPDFFAKLGFVVMDRAAAPAAVTESVEFRGTCPSSATMMVLTLAPKAPTINVRAATETDLARVCAIYNEAIDAGCSTFETTHRRPADISAWLSHPRYPFLVAEQDGNVQGWARLFLYRDRECYAHIADFSVYVTSEARQSGVATRLVETLLQRGEEKGIAKVVARVFADNAPSRALCRKCGFREVGVYERHGRINGAWKDVVVVERLMKAAFEG